MAIVEVSQPSQPRQALDRANKVRAAAAELKREVKAGKLTVRQALSDERAGAVTVIDLLRCQAGVRLYTAAKLLEAKAMEDPANRIPSSKRVRDLTDRQRGLIAEWCES
jgi:hypothetical protein